MTYTVEVYVSVANPFSVARYKKVYVSSAESFFFFFFFVVLVSFTVELSNRGSSIQSFRIPLCKRTCAASPPQPCLSFSFFAGRRSLCHLSRKTSLPRPLLANLAPYISPPARRFTFPGGAFGFLKEEKLCGAKEAGLICVASPPLHSARASLPHA